jgi:hypothetical protein
VTCEFEVTGIGPFEFPIHLFLEEQGIREAECTVHGTGKPKEVVTDGFTPVSLR